MEFKIECPWCNQHYSVDESLIGQNVECSVCSKQFTVKKPCDSSTATKIQPENFFSDNLSKQKNTNKTIASQNNTPKKQKVVSKRNIWISVIAFAALVALLIVSIVSYNAIPEKEYKKGLAAYSEQRYEEAIEFLQKAAERGHEKAEAEIYYIYGEKAYKEHCFNDASEYYKKAEELGHVKAKAGYDKAQKEQKKIVAEINYTNGEMAYKEQRFEEATKYYRKAEELGHAKAKAGYDKAQKEQQKQLSLAKLTEAKNAIDGHRFEEAVKLLQEPASLGNPEAQFLLGTCYYNGEGIKRDVDEAAKWFRKAAEQGDMDAQYKLGLSYLSGSGVAFREDEALYWLQRSAKQGHPKAQIALGDLYYKKGSNQDFSKAFECYQKAGEIAVSSRAEELLICSLFLDANKGDANSQFILYTLYHEGKDPIAKDDSEAIKWLVKSANSGYPEAEALLGINIFLGQNGVKKNIAEGIQWIQKAADHGNIDAQYHLGEYYFADRQYKKAIPLLRSAAEGGNIAAMDKLYNCYREGIGVKKNWDEAVKWLKKQQETARSKVYE